MAPLPDNNTSRLFVAYVVGTTKHTVVFRFGTGVALADRITQSRALITTLRPLMSTGVAFNAVRFSEAGSSVSQPATWGTAITGTSAATVDAWEGPQFISFVGRDSLGRDVKLTFFGYTGAVPANYRLQGSADVNVQAMVNALNAAVPFPATISGGAPIWAPYANVGLNAYWQRKARRSG